MDDHNHFTKFLRVTDAVTGAQSRNILLFVDNHATYPQDKLFLQNVIFTNNPPNLKSTIRSTTSGHG
jgi:hypothetical protein